MYRRWLLSCVFERGWSTLKCANILLADNPDLDPVAFREAVREDFERFVKESCDGVH